MIPFNAFSIRPNDPINVANPKPVGQAVQSGAPVAGGALDAILNPGARPGVAPASPAVAAPADPLQAIRDVIAQIEQAQIEAIRSQFRPLLQNLRGDTRRGRREIRETGRGARESLRSQGADLQANLAAVDGQVASDRAAMAGDVAAADAGTQGDITALREIMDGTRSRLDGLAVQNNQNQIGTSRLIQQAGISALRNNAADLRAQLRSQRAAQVGEARLQALQQQAQLDMALAQAGIAGGSISLGGGGGGGGGGISFSGGGGGGGGGGRGSSGGGGSSGSSGSSRSGDGVKIEGTDLVLSRMFGMDPVRIAALREASYLDNVLSDRQDRREERRAGRDTVAYLRSLYPELAPLSDDQLLLMHQSGQLDRHLDDLAAAEEQAAAEQQMLDDAEYYRRGLAAGTLTFDMIPGEMQAAVIRAMEADAAAQQEQGLRDIFSQFSFVPDGMEFRAGSSVLPPGPGGIPAGSTPGLPSMLGVAGPNHQVLNPRSGLAGSVDAALRRLQTSTPVVPQFEAPTFQGLNQEALAASIAEAVASAVALAGQPQAAPRPAPAAAPRPTTGAPQGVPGLGAAIAAAINDRPSNPFRTAAV